MKLTEFFTDDSAVSPVIGVILMVAITVILAAVIGSFVLNLGGSLQQSAPQASFDFDYSDSDVTITHSSGDSITDDGTGDLNVTNGANSSSWDSSFPVTAGDSMTWGSGNYSSGDTIRVVWTSTNGETSATLSESTAP